MPAAITDHVSAAGFAHQRLAHPAFDPAAGEWIAFRRTPARPVAAGLPGVVFLGGFKSDMTGTKATALEAHCAARGLGFLRFDYQGHGLSSGDFRDGTIGRWATDAGAALDHLTEGRQILIGSSMGLWTTLLAARARPARVAGIIGIAGAPDFTERLMWDRWDDARRRQVMEEGAWERPSAYDIKPYPITRTLIEDGRRHLVLDGIDLACPVRLLHGMADPDVPWQHSLLTMAALAGSDVRLTLIKDGDHRLSRDEDLALMLATLDALIAETSSGGRE